MRTTITATLLGLLLVTPVAAQTPNMQQLLGGLLTGNQGQDQALQQAYERGYRHGRDDQARQDRLDRRGSADQRYDGRNLNRGDYRDQAVPGQRYGQPRAPSYDPNAPYDGGR